MKKIAVHCAIYYYAYTKGRVAWTKSCRSPHTVPTRLGHFAECCSGMSIIMARIVHSCVHGCHPQRRDRFVSLFDVWTPWQIGDQCDNGPCIWYSYCPANLSTLIPLYPIVGDGARCHAFVALFQLWTRSFMLAEDYALLGDTEFRRNSFSTFLITFTDRLINKCTRAWIFCID